MKILITGATGLVGQELGLELVRRGHEIVALSRRPEEARLQLPFPATVLSGDLTQGPLAKAELESVEAVVHLMGEPVAEGRWTEDKKKRLVDSRVKATQNLLASLTRPRVFVSASAVGFYGDRGEEVLQEDSAPGQGFLAELCRNWETEAMKAQELGAQVSILRIGVVLSLQGGALPEMLTPFRAGVGGPLGGGQQWMSWIHIKDLVKMLAAAVEGQVKGRLNAVAPEPATNRDLSKKLAALIHRPSLLPTPSFALKMLFGEKASILLASQRVLPKAALAQGFRFEFANLDSALADLLAEMSRGEDVFLARQWLPQKPEEIFPFFAEAKNLENITPESLHFRIVNMSTPQIQEGTLIDYRLKIHGVPTGWRTRIESWNPPFEFVDTQIKGPYSLWHHTHRFEALAGGTLMTDRVRYRLPMGYLGWLGGSALVKADVSRIFTYRRKKVPGTFS